MEALAGMVRFLRSRPAVFDSEEVRHMGNRAHRHPGTWTPRHMGTRASLHLDTEAQSVPTGHVIRS